MLLPSRLLQLMFVIGTALTRVARCCVNGFDFTRGQRQALAAEQAVRDELDALPEKEASADLDSSTLHPSPTRSEPDEFDAINASLSEFDAITGSFTASSLPEFDEIAERVAPASPADRVPARQQQQQQQQQQARSQSPSAQITQILEPVIHDL